MYSHSVLMGWVSKLLLSHQRKRKKLRCSCLTLTWWNIPWMSHMTATCSWRNLHSTPTRSLVRSGPWRRCRLRHSPANSTLQSQTIFIFSGFLVWHTPRWGIYHTWPFFLHQVYPQRFAWWSKCQIDHQVKRKSWTCELVVFINLVVSRYWHNKGIPHWIDAGVSGTYFSAMGYRVSLRCFTTFWIWRSILVCQGIIM